MSRIGRAPITIPAGASLSQTLCCPDGIIRVGSTTLVFLPYNDRKSAINNISVMIPFEIEGQKEIYTFAFHILDTKEIQDISAQQKK